MEALNIKALEEIAKCLNEDDLAVIYNHSIEFYECECEYCTPYNVHTIIPDRFTFHEVAVYIADHFFEIDGITHADIGGKIYQMFLAWCLVNTTIPQDWIKKSISYYDVVENDWNYILSWIECDYKRKEL